LLISILFVGIYSTNNVDILFGRYLK